MAQSPRASRFQIPNPPPGPNAQPREWAEWADSVNVALKALTFAAQSTLGNDSINLASSAVLSDLSDTAPQTLTPDIGNSAGVGTKASRDDHKHNVPAAAPSNIGNANTEGTSSSFARADHTHDLATAGDTNYLRRDGGNSPTGDIVPDIDNTRDLGDAVTPKGYGLVAANQHVGVGSAPAFLITTNGTDSQGFIWLDTSGPKFLTNAQPATHYSGSDIDAGGNAYLALEKFTPLNLLKTATAAYSMGGFNLTSLGGLRANADNANDIGAVATRFANAYLINVSAGAALLSLRSTKADASGVVGVESYWDVQDSTLSSTSKIHAFYWSNSTPIKKLAAAVYAQGYSHGGSGSAGPAVVAVYDTATTARLGIVKEGSEGEFTGFETSDAGSTVNFYVKSSVAMNLGASGSINRLQTLDTESGTDFRLRLRGSNGANTTLGLWERRNAATPAAGTRLAQFRENITAVGSVDRLNVWSDNSKGGAGVPQNQQFSFDDSGTTQGDTLLKYVSASTRLECEVDAKDIWHANAGGAFVGGSAGANLGLGQVDTLAVSSAGTTTLTIGTDEQVQYVTATAGVGAYTHNIDLSSTGAVEGSTFWINVDIQDAANPTVDVRNGDDSTVLASMNGTAADFCVVCVWDGAAWQRLIGVQNDL